MRNQQETLHSQTAKLIGMIAQCLPQELHESTMQAFIQNPKQLKAALKLALMRPREMFFPKRTWKTITIGGVVSRMQSIGSLLGTEAVVDRFCELLESANVDCSVAETRKWLREIKIRSPRATYEVRLALVSPRDLGFHEDPWYNVFCDAALMQGFLLCPFEVGVQLPLQVKDLQEGQSVVIGTPQVLYQPKDEREPYPHEVPELCWTKDRHHLQFGHLHHIHLDTKVVLVIPAR